MHEEHLEHPSGASTLGETFSGETRATSASPRVLLQRTFRRVHNLTSGPEVLASPGDVQQRRRTRPVGTQYPIRTDTLRCVRSGRPTGLLSRPGEGASPSPKPEIGEKRNPGRSRRKSAYVATSTFWRRRRVFSEDFSAHCGLVQTSSDDSAGMNELIQWDVQGGRQ